MINVKKLLLKLIRRNQKIGESAESFINQIYPVGSVIVRYQSSALTNWLGGTWTGTTREWATAQIFNATTAADATNSSNYFTWNTTFCDPLRATIARYPTYIMMRLQWNNKQAISDNEVVVFTCTTEQLNAMGFEGNYQPFSSMVFVYSDDLNAIGMARLRNGYTDGYPVKLTIDDWVTAGTSRSTSTGKSCWATIFLYARDYARSPETCSHFYYERTA